MAAPIGRHFARVGRCRFRGRDCTVKRVAPHPACALESAVELKARTADRVDECVAPPRERADRRAHERDHVDSVPHRGEIHEHRWEGARDPEPAHDTDEAASVAPGPGTVMLVHEGSRLWGIDRALSVRDRASREREHGSGQERAEGHADLKR